MLRMTLWIISGTIFTLQFAFAAPPVFYSPESTGSVSIAKQVSNPKLSNVIIDGGITYLSSDAEFTNIGSFELKNGATLIIGNYNLNITANTLISDGGSILSWGPNLSKAPNGLNGGTPGASGTSGSSGISAGSLEINLKRIVLTSPDKPLLIDLSGQYGGDGGNGFKGATGPIGASGDPARYHWVSHGSDPEMQCSREAGDGQPGGPGYSGGNGGAPGDGGYGGNITVHVASGIINNLVSAKSAASAGGVGGSAGEGGDGGQGGQPGTEDPNYPCGNPKLGPQGSQGPFGTDLSKQHGHPGQAGIINL